MSAHSREFKLRELIASYFSDSDFYKLNKEWIMFELNHLEIHELDNYLFNLYTNNVSGLPNKNNSNIAYLIGITDVCPTFRITTKGGTSPD